MATAKTKRTSIAVEMAHERDTKGTFVYSASDDAAPIPTLYVKKSGFPDGPPESVTVTVEAASA